MQVNNINNIKISCPVQKVDEINHYQAIKRIKKVQSIFHKVIRLTINLIRRIKEIAIFIFAGVIIRNKFLQRRLKKEIIATDVKGINGANHILLNDIARIRECLKPGDIILHCDGPTGGDWRVRFGQCFSKIAMVNKSSVNSHYFGHSAQYLVDEKGNDFIIEATIGKGKINGKEIHDDVRRIPFKEWIMFKEKDNVDTFIQIVRLKDQVLAKRTNDQALKFANISTEEDPKPSVIKYAKLKAAKSIFSSTKFTKSTIRDMIMYSVLMDNPPKFRDDRVYWGNMFCSMFTSGMIQWTATKIFLERLREINPDDKDLVFEKKINKMELKKWANRIMKKYSREIMDNFLYQYNPNGINPQDYEGIILDNPDIYDRIYSLVPKNHPSLPKKIHKTDQSPKKVKISQKDIQEILKSLKKPS